MVCLYLLYIYMYIARQKYMHVLYSYVFTVWPISRKPRLSESRTKPFSILNLVQTSNSSFFLSNIHVVASTDHNHFKLIWKSAPLVGPLSSKVLDLSWGSLAWKRLLWSSDHGTMVLVTPIFLLSRFSTQIQFPPIFPTIRYAALSQKAWA